MRRKHSAHTNASETKAKYFVQVSREEKGEPKTTRFQKREDALAFAERQEARRMRVRGTNFKGKEIYSSQ
jgi:hypothetical protein